MKIVKIAYKTKCDFPGCKNLAEKNICDEKDSAKKFQLCDECLNNIYNCVAKTIIPKGIEAPFKNQRKLR